MKRILIIALILFTLVNLVPKQALADVGFWDWLNTEYKSDGSSAAKVGAVKTQEAENAGLKMPTADTQIDPARAGKLPSSISQQGLNNIKSAAEANPSDQNKQKTYNDLNSYIDAWQRGYQGTQGDYYAAQTQTPNQINKYIDSATTKPVCDVDAIDICIINAFYNIVEFLGNIILGFAAWILWACGIMLNFSIITFIVNMKSAIDKIPVIFTVWQIVRDLTNMFFIFILLFIAIQAILQQGNYKKMLINVVLVALFINFSFFATGVMIDASNIIALQFYNGFAGEGCADGCVSQNIVKALKLGSLYDVNSATNTDGSVKTPDNPSLFADPKISLGPFLITVISGSILMIITAGIFIASAIMVFARFVTLIFVLMLSPLAFAATIMPGMNGYFKKWKDPLTSQLIFAPAYFMFLWIVMKIINSGILKPNAGFNDGFKGDAIALFSLLGNYIIIIMLLCYSLILAKDLGGAGVGIATKAAKGFQGMVGRNTVGRVSSRIANSQAVNKLTTRLPFAGRMVQKSFDAGAKASFGGKKGGFDQAEKDAIKQRTETAKRLGPSTLMSETAKSNLAQAKDAENKRKEDVDEQMKEKYGNQEAAVAPDKIATAEKELEAQKTELATLLATKKTNKYGAPVAGLSDEEKAAAEKKIADNAAVIEAMKQKKEEIAKQKAADIEDMMRMHKDRTREAQENNDRTNGVNKEEATRRAEGLADQKDELKGDANKEARKKFIEEMVANNGVDKDYIRKTGIEKGFGGEELDKFIKTQTDIKKKENLGLAKVRQEEFAKNAESDYGASKLKKLGILGKIAGTSIDVISSHTTRVAGSAEVRSKVIKGKSEAEKLYDEAKKAAAEEAKGEKSTDEPKKDDAKDKPKTS